MKSQRRHKLQENSLGLEFARVVEFFRKHGNAIAWGLLVTALVVFVGVYAYTRHRSTAARLQTQFDRAMGDPTLDPQERVRLLEELARQDDDEGKAALATVELGDEYLRRMIVAGSRTDAAERKRLSEKAAGYYQTAIDRFTDQDLPLGKAHLGRARLAESQGDFDGAKVEYETVLKLTSLMGTPVTREARRGLQQLKQLTSPVAMATTAPSEASSSQPVDDAASQPMVVDQPAQGATQPVP